MAEGFPTFLTHVRLTVVVNLMPCKVSLLLKDFHTLATLAGFHILARLPVVFKNRVLANGFSTFRTHKRLFSKVGSLMLNKVKVSSECFPTPSTYEWVFKCRKPLLAS